MSELEPVTEYLTYDSLIETFPAKVLLIVDDNGYQGSSRVLLADGDRRGFLVFGWGSCSGCDALEACNSLDEVTELRDQLWTSVQWHDNAASLLDYFRAKDWSLEWGSGAEFGTKAIAILEGQS